MSSPVRLTVSGQTAPRDSRGTEVSCYGCTAKFTLQEVILGEVDFRVGAKQRIDQMVLRVRDKAQGTASPQQPATQRWS